MNSFIEELEKLNLFLVEQNGDLILKGRKGQLTQKEIELIRQNGFITDFIRKNKAELIRHLAAEQPRQRAIYKLSPLQEGMLFHYLYDSDSRVYIEQFAVDLPAGVNAEALEKAWGWVIRRHSILRTGFIHDRTSVPLQVVHPQLDFAVQETDLTAFDADQLEKELERLLDQDLSTGFDLQTPPLMRVNLIKTGEKAWKMVWTYHHILLDGWSLPIVVNELLTAYEAYCDGKTPAPQEEDLFEDYIKYLNRQEGYKAEAFWKKYLDGFETPSLLPFTNSHLDRNKGGATVKKVQHTFDAVQTAAIKDYVQSRNITVNTLIQGVWSVLLSYYSGNQDVAFGVTVSGRPMDLKDADRKVGLFINILPFRAEIRPGDKAGEWLSALQEGHAAAREYQYHALNEIQQWSGITGDFFDSLLVFENYPVDEAVREKKWALELGDVRVQEQTNYLLTIVAGMGNTLDLKFIYNSDLLNDVYAEMISRHFATLVTRIAISGQEDLSGIRILTDEEEKQLIAESGSVGYPAGMSLVDLFTDQAAETPDSVAVVFRDRQLSYSELDERSTRLANRLIEKGINRESLIPILLDPSPELIIAILGILKAGGAYVPVDPEYPVDRIRFIIGDTGAGTIIADRKFAGLLAEVSGAESLFMDDNSLWTGEKSPQFRQHSPAPESLAYVIYTSGSTGKPKGVLVEHKHVVRLLKTDKPLFDFNERDVWTLFHSHAFDFSVWEIFGALLFGAKLVIVPSEMRKEPRAFAQLISEQAVTVLNQTPGAFYQLQHAFTPSHNAGSLRYVIFGGEALDPALLQSWKEQYPPCRLINMYGITETTVHVTFKEIEEKDIRSGISNIGRAIPTLSCYVLDQHMRHLPAGVPGELFVAGEGVARGYLNRETLTAERFLEDPFSARGAGRIYKTGDLARRLPDGNFEYLGRIDNQVKIRGYRIELGEIEATLRMAPGVAQAVVAAKEGHDGVKRLIAYVLPQGSLEKAAVQAYLRSVLPAYMVPANLIELDAFPLTRNGKIDKKALPDPEHTTGPGAHFAAPQNETERALLDIWKGLLGVATLGTRDNFFETGGHSLLAMRVIAAVRKQLKRELRVKDIFTFPTVESLALHMEAGTRKSVLLPPVTTGKRPLRLPLSYSQERLWFIHQMGGSAQYHLPTVIRLKNQINREGLEAAFSALINRHESLRTVISQDDGQPFQTILPAEGWKMAFSERPSPENGNSPDQFISEEISRPFNLSKDFPLRARLIRYGDNDHCLVIVLHHIASDGWSESVLVRDLTELYNAYVENRPAALAPLQVQYADYAIWQRQHLSDLYLESLLDWWEARLKGVEPIKLPTDYRRPAVQSHRGANWGLPLDKALSAAIKDLSIQMGTTPFMTMLAAFKVLLYRYSGQQDICVGTPVANRNSGELDQLAGFFVNTIALRTQIDGNRQAGELLKQIKEESLAAFSRQEAPFEQIVGRVVADRSLSRSPVFQVMFIMQNNPETPDLKLNGLDLSFEAPGGQTAQFDLTFSLVEADGQFYLGIEYCTDLFTPETIERMAGHFIQLAGSFVAAPETRVDDLRMTTETEENLLRKVFNQTVEPFPDDLTLVDLFCSQAGQTPDLIAAAFEGETITYRELDQRSNALARFLKKAGAGPDTLVAICIGRSLEMITGILGILKAGGAYVPVDPEYPGHRINYLLEDTGVRIAVSVRDFAHLLAGENKIKTILLDEDWPEIALESGDRVEAGIKPENLAYVIYTSGSTGRPKGVMNQHSGVVNRLLWGKKTFGLEPGKDAVLQKTTFSFDVSVWEIFWPLISGAQLVLARPGGHKDNAYVKSLISSRAITTVHFVPSMLEVFLQDLEQGELPGLRQVFCSGEELKPAHVDLFAQRLPHVELHNLYGPTETAIEVSWLHLPAGQDRKAETVTIGKPIANTALYVGSPNGRLSGIGVPGELLIGGIQVARGYLNRQAVTAEKFIPNPFAADGSGSRLYKSGDLARVLPDGQVEFLGRIDTQVKIRGYRIELSEIEFVLRQLPGIRQCAVIAKTGENVNPGLIAYVVRDGSATETAGLDGKVRDWLKERLPDYMVPAVVAELNELPLTANGKLDIKALPETAHGQEAAKTYIAPADATESALAEIWAKLLRMDRVSVSDNFFEIGGHSLLAMRMISAVRRELNAELEVLDVFTHPTVREMAARLNENDLKPVLPPPVAGERPDEIPLSYSQERLWFIDQLEGSIHYHQPTILRIRSEVDISILEKALGALVERHEVLRTVFRVKTGQPYQVILPAGGWKLSFSADKAFADKSQLQSFIAAEVRKPFDLTADYMLRASLVKSGDNDFTLILVRHHIASDGWSESILVSDLAALYSAAKNGRKPDLPGLPVQYADYAIWQRKHQSGAYLEAHLEWWKNHLRELEPLELPTDFPRPTIRSTRGATMRFRIDSGLTNQLKDLANNSGATLFMTLVAAYKVLLFKYSGQEDICIGTPLANRNYKELEPVVGFFINNLVLRTSLEGGPGFRELLQRVKTSTLSAFRHQDVPFEQIVDEIEKNRNLSRNPIFQVTFAMQNTPDIPEMVLEGLDVSFESSAHSASRFDMNFSVTETRQGLAVAIEYCSDLFTESRIAGMATHFEELLRSAVADPEMPVGRLKMLSQEEERQVVFGFNETEFEFPQDKTLMELFRAQVAETPDHIAAVFEEKTLTYRELDRLSNRFGHYLRQNFPIAPDDRIAIKIERSEWMLVTIFGILKAGGAYVPIDPAFPEDRVAFMLGDSAAKVLIDERELQKFRTEQAQHPDTAPVSGTTPGNLAYVIYTSGSTGKAKGVQIEHRTVVSEILYLKEKFRISEKDRVLQTANYVFDPSVEQIFIALLSGATLVLIRKETLLDKDRMEEILTKERVTYLHTTPSLLQLIKPGKYPALRQISSGGEFCTLALARSWAPYLQFVNKYGPTEATVTSTIYFYHLPSNPESETSLPVGRPLGNVKTYVMDNWGNPVPIGVNGEICIGGGNLARGYLNRPGLTEEKFVDSPFCPGERIYKTGDIGRWLPDGNLEFIARKDDQVKIRGYRIEPGEIESVIQSSGLVGQAIVMARDGRAGGKRLVAYLTLKEGVDQQEIKTYLEARLPEYMVPSAIVTLNEFPLTVNGKVDKKALPEADETANSAENSEEPRTPAETALAAIWKETLKIDQVGIKDSFFELGGHSLLAMRVISAVRHKMKLEVRVRDIFTHPTLEGFARQLDTLRQENALPPIGSTTRPKQIPLSYAQERLWFIDQFEGSVHYHQPTVMRIAGKPDPKILRAAFTALIERHEVLRTVIKTDDGRPYQEVIPAGSWQLEHTAMFNARDDESLKHFIVTEINRPFDLSADFMLRAHLISIEEDLHLLVVVMHHIASDGWSQPILVKDLMELYSAGLEVRTPSLPALPVQYADFAVWQREHYGGKYLAEQLDWWAEHLRGIEPIELPCDFNRPPALTMKGSSLGFQLDKTLSGQLKTLAVRSDASLFMTLLTAFNVLLYRYSGQEDICVGTPVANRDRKEIESLVGFFINNLVLRTNLEGDPGFLELLSRVRQETLAAFARQDAPFEQIVERVENQRDLSRSPLFQVVFMMQGADEAPELKLGNLDITFEPPGQNLTRFELTFSVDEGPEGLRLGISYSTDLFSRDSIARMGEHFIALLRSIAASPGEKISRLNLLTEAEKNQLLSEFNTAEVEIPEGSTLVDLFREQAEKTPDSTAVVCRDRELSYREFDAETNKIGAFLRKSGLREGSLAAVCIDNPFDMVLAIWGVLKGGGTYLPLDHENPADRINAILDNAGVDFAVVNARTAGLIRQRPGLAIIVIDDCREAIASAADEEIELSLTPESLVYVIHTSGSTGVPKGVMLSHRNVIDHLYGFFSRVTFRASRTFAIMSTLSADLSKTVLFGALITGGTIHLIEKETYTDAGKTHEYFRKNSIDFIKLVPSHWLALENEEGVLIPNRTIVFGGEVLSPEILQKIKSAAPALEIINHYGPTEVTIGKVCYRVDLEAVPDKTPIGKPFCNTRLYVVDRHMALCPVGVPGELLIGGTGVSKGYINRPELTSERFIKDPFSEREDEIVYRSGDLIRWLPDGNLDFIGRVDDQVKIRGYRIELGEINTVLRQAPAVGHCAVLAKAGPDGQKRLVAYVAADKTQAATLERPSIMTFLRARLPEYMVPTVLVEMDKIPLNANGKIDRRSLPDPFAETLHQDDFVPPGNKTQEQLAGIWKGLLGMERVGIHDNFFEIGGHSLLAMRVITAIRKQFSLHVPIKIIFKYPSIAELEEYILLMKESESELNFETSEVLEL